jgi:serine/threonine protein phosphatase PrpC
MRTARRCHWCGAPSGEVDDCAVCGRPVSAAARDHLELDLGAIAGVSDRGTGRARNEDALYLGGTGIDHGAAVVCDGVGSSANGDIAAQIAADTAGEVLLELVQSFDERLSTGTNRAIDAAAEAVAALPRIGDRSIPPPASTLVSVAWRHDEIAVGWVGDSRGYWLGPDGPRIVTSDDTWASHELKVGRLSAAEVASYPRSGAITRWLGAGTPLVRPHVVAFRTHTSGRIVICSDGLWRYLPTISTLVSAVADTGPRSSAIRTALALTNFALVAGGQDNVTVAVIDVRLNPEAHHA